MNKNIIIVVVLLIVVGAGAFFGGMQYQKSQTSSLTGGRGFYRQGGGFGGANSNLRPVRGQVISQDNNSLTVKMTDGSTKIVLLSGNTIFLKSATASASDVKLGDTIMALGNQNSDGSITASNVQINPPARMVRGN